MAKYLNVDALTPEVKVLTLNGVEHEMHHVTVKEFIEIAKASQESDDGKLSDKPPHEQVVLLVDQILKAFPSIPRGELEDLTIEKLTAILKFTAGALEEEAQAKAQVSDKKK
jgi:hypothetical protein